MQGWVSIHRSLQSHWLWEDKPFSKGQAWIDILLLANHQDNKFLLGNELVEVEQGSFITSEVKLMDRWGWSKTKVRNFLKILEEDNMLIKKSDTKKTTLTVVNYKVYQDKETTQRPLEDHLKTTQRPLEDTNNNVNNDNKKDIYILSDSENKFINILLKIDNYPLDRKKDLDMYKTLEERYPTLDLVEAIEQWRMYKMDKPLKSNSNARSQINTSFKNYVEWNKCLKGTNGTNNSNDPYAGMEIY